MWSNIFGRHENAGITLIALVITIIVILILAGVSITMLTGDNGILTRAGEVVTVTDVAEVKEKIQLELLAKQVDTEGTYTEDDVLSAVQEVLGSGATINETGNEDGSTTYTVTTEKGNVVDISDIMADAEESVETISTEISYVGYYADVDGNGSVDGVIYVDLMDSDNTSGEWRR